MRAVFALAVLAALVAISMAYSYRRDYRRPYYMKTHYDTRDRSHDDSYEKRGYRYRHYKDSNEYDRHDNRYDDSYDDSHDDSQYDGKRRGQHDDRREYNRHDSQESHESKEYRDSEEHHEEEDDHIYRFQVSESYGPYEYMDEEGHVLGFNIDIMKAVCHHAHKKCHFVYDKHSNCWETDHGFEYPGEGLQAGFYDGCLGMFPTVERMNSFNFSMPYTKAFKTTLFYHKDAGLMDADDHDLTDHKIGFMDGWVSSQHCLERQGGFKGHHIGEYTPVFYTTHKQMYDDIMHDKVDAGLTVDVFDTHELELAHAEPSFYCVTGGNSMMAPYGSPVLAWWDKAFEEMKHNGEYRDVCANAEIEHHHRGHVSCLD